MNYEESSKKIREKLAKLTDTDAKDWHLCLKARFGMAIVFESIRDILGSGEIITTPYTCITAVNPILVAGLTPIYHDIDTSLLSTGKPDEKYLKDKTHAIVMQHTVGLITDKTSIKRFADKHKILLIEDAAHCVTRFARDKDNKILADISIHSFGVEKILTGTKFGGAIYVNPELKTKNPDLHQHITYKLGRLKKPGKQMGFRVRTYRINNAIIQRLRGNLRHNFRNFEIKAGILEPPIYPFEQDGQQDEPCTTNKFVNEKILEQLETLKGNYIRRAANVDLYISKLKSKNFSKVTNAHEPLLAFPIVFESEEKANAAYHMLTTQGYFIRRWYSPLLYPGPNSLKIYRYNPKKSPIAEDVSKRVLCLPTDLPVIETNKIIESLKDHKNPVQKPVEN
ncbi:MAG: DegT/DnrJ/EryC1/StrS family aminotransferase [Candidatus Saccharibacteria bacterium]|nr:DegT/DnrJ/EryC1/StrS family aminotransferase [Candidatus Saccharibacteria bacterium]